ncbi:MAG: glycosyltransferase [Patescibacteria group bacterium]|nr:glycosyltransferase [Patescibacteria group bacterium]
MNNSEKILISIGIPVFNGSKTLTKTLESIKKQTFKKYEVLISDNHSSDDTGKIAQEFCRKDKRFKYIRQRKNIGPIENFLFLVKNTSGEYFTWLSDDDYYENDNLLEELFRPNCKGIRLCFSECKKNYA